MDNHRTGSVQKASWDDVAELRSMSGPERRFLGIGRGCYREVTKNEKAEDLSPALDYDIEWLL